MIKILHCADLHLGSPFHSESVEKSEARRHELEGTFSTMLMYVKENHIDLVLLAGDLFDSEYVTRETVSYVFSGFRSLPECRFVISPGNHDPYSAGSPYADHDLPENVFVFRDQAICRFSFDDLQTDVYGFGFTDTHMAESPLTGFRVENDGRIHLLCAHCDVGAPLSPYCPVSENDLALCGFDYAALGHVHKSTGICRAGNTLYAYSGCLEGRDFGETGHKGGILVSIEKNGSCQIETKGIRFSRRRYEILSVDISGLSDLDDVTAHIKKQLSFQKLGADTLLRLELNGVVSPDLRLNCRRIADEIGERLYYCEVEDHTLPLYGDDVLLHDVTIRGAFFRALLPMMESGTAEQRRLAADALRIGLCAMAGKDITDIVT